MASQRSSFIVRVVKENDTRRIRVVVPSSSTWDDFLSLLRSRFALNSDASIEIHDNRGSQLVCLDDVLDEDELVIRTLTWTCGRGDHTTNSDVVVWAALCGARLSDFRLKCTLPLKRDRKVVTATLPRVSTSHLFRLLFVGGDLVSLVGRSASATLDRVVDDSRVAREIAKALILTGVPRHANVLRWWTRIDVDEAVYDALPGRMMYQLKDSLLPLVQMERTAAVLVFDYHALTLRKMLDEMPKPLSLQTVLQLLLEISSVLMFLNEQRLVLRNLDINHIQISSCGTLILSDFSSVCGVNELITANVLYLDAQLTPPEVMEHALVPQARVGVEQIDARLCHVWSLGVVGCQLTTGASVGEVVSQHEHILNPLLEIYPETLIHLLKSCTDVDTTRRPDFSSVHRDLLQLQQNRQTRSPQLPVRAHEHVPEVEISPDASPQHHSTLQQAIAPATHEHNGGLSSRDHVVGLMTFPIAEPEHVRSSRTRMGEDIAANSESHLDTENLPGGDAPPSYSEVCGNAEAQSVGTLSSSDDEGAAQFNDVPPPLPTSRRPTLPHQLSRQSGPVSAGTPRDYPPYGDSHGIQRQQGQSLSHYSNEESTSIAAVHNDAASNVSHLDSIDADVETFCTVTSASRSVAQYYLLLCDGVLEDAVGLYMEACRSTQRDTRQERASMSNRRSVFERPRTDGHQRAHAVIQDGHQSLRRPPRAGTRVAAHRRSWAGTTMQSVSSVREHEQLRRRVSEGTNQLSSVHSPSQSARRRGWCCPHSREPRECVICAMFPSNTNQSTTGEQQRNARRRERNRHQRRQSRNCKIS